MSSSFEPLTGLTTIIADSVETSNLSAINANITNLVTLIHSTSQRNNIVVYNTTTQTLGYSNTVLTTGYTGYTG